MNLGLSSVQGDLLDVLGCILQYSLYYLCMVDIGVYYDMDGVETSSESMMT